MSDLETALIGKRITAVEVSKDRETITLTTTEGPVRLQVGAE